MGIKWTDLSEYQQSLAELPASPRAQILRAASRGQPEAVEQANFALACKARGWRAVWHRTDKRSTANRGCPDFIVAAGGTTFWIEFKRPGSELRPDQAAFKKELAANGIEMHVATSAEGAVAIIEAWSDPNSALLERALEALECDAIPWGEYNALRAELRERALDTARTSATRSSQKKGQYAGQAQTRLSGSHTDPADAPGRVQEEVHRPYL